MDRRPPTRTAAPTSPGADAGFFPGPTSRSLTESGGYSQVDKLTELRGAVDTDLPFFDQFVYQHMQAYLEMTGLTAMGINQNTFFDPLA